MLKLLVPHVISRLYKVKINLGNRSKKMRGRGYWLRIMSLVMFCSQREDAIEFTFICNKTSQMQQFPKFTLA
jgi:hypothetical protein